MIQPMKVKRIVACALILCAMVSHDVPQVFEVSDQVAFMHLGKMELVGSVSEVMSSDNQNFKRFLAGKASGEDELSTSRVGAIAGR